MSDSKAPLLPHELDAIPDPHLRERILASLEDARAEAEKAKEEVEERIENARTEERKEAEDEWRDQINAAEAAKNKAEDERNALFRAVDDLAVNGILRGDKRRIKVGLKSLAEELLKAEMINTVDQAELEGAADYLSKATI